MKKLIMVLLFLFIIGSLSVVSAGNNTTIVDNAQIHYENGDMVQALESGDSNISFSDGFQGYCIEWGEKSAEKGDSFYIHDNVDNRIKVFFVYFYNETQVDVIKTQHMIWKFSDNKTFSRFDPILYDKIIQKAATTNVPNQGNLKLNDHTEMLFDFRNFVSPITKHQNYFGYKIIFRNITTNQSIQINNSMDNISDTLIPIYKNNESYILFNQTLDEISNKKTISSTLNNTKIQLSKNITGVNLQWLFGWIIILSILCLLFYKKE